MRTLVFDLRSRFEKGLPGGVIACVIVMLILVATSDPDSSCYWEPSAPQEAAASARR